MNSPRIPVYRFNSPPVGQPGYVNNGTRYPHLPAASLPPHPQPTSPVSYGVYVVPPQGVNIGDYPQYPQSQQQYAAYPPQQQSPIIQTPPPLYMPATTPGRPFRATTPPINAAPGTFTQYRSSVTPPVTSTNYTNYSPNSNYSQNQFTTSMQQVASNAFHTSVSGTCQPQTVMSQKSDIDINFAAGASLQFHQSHYFQNSGKTTPEYMPSSTGSKIHWSAHATDSYVQQPSHITGSHIQNQSYLGVYSDDQAMFLKDLNVKGKADISVSTAEDMFKAKASKCGIEITTKKEHRQKVSEKLAKNAKITKEVSEKLSNIETDIFKEKASRYGIQIETPNEKNYKKVDKDENVNFVLEKTGLKSDMKQELFELSESLNTFCETSTEDKGHVIERDEFGAVEITEQNKGSPNQNKELFKLMASHHGITIKSPSPKKLRMVLDADVDDIEGDDSFESALENLESKNDSVDEEVEDLLSSENGILGNQVLLAVTGAYRSPSMCVPKKVKVDENTEITSSETSCEKIAKKIVSDCIASAFEELIAEGYFVDSGECKKRLYSWEYSKEGLLEDSSTQEVYVVENVDSFKEKTNQYDFENKTKNTGEMSVLDKISKLSEQETELNIITEDCGKKHDCMGPSEELIGTDIEKSDMKPTVIKLEVEKNEANVFAGLNPSVPEFKPKFEDENFNNNQEKEVNGKISNNIIGLDPVTKEFKPIMKKELQNILQSDIESSSESEFDRSRSNSFANLNPSTPEFRPKGSKGSFRYEKESSAESDFEISRSNSLQELNPGTPEFRPKGNKDSYIHNDGESCNQNEFERSGNHSSTNLNPSSPEFKPSGLKYMMEYYNNGGESDRNADVRKMAPFFQPSFHIKPHTQSVKKRQSSTQTEIVETSDKSNNTKRIKQTSQQIETQSCDLREVCVNTVETFNDESSDFYVPPPEVADCGIMTEPVKSHDVGVMWQVEKEDKSSLTEVNDDLYQLLRNTQRELLRLRFQLCMEEIQRQIEDLQKNMEHWVQMFSAVSERKCLEDIIESRVTSLKIETNILQSKLLMYEDQLNEGQVWQKVPCFGLSLPVGPCDIKVLNRQEKSHDLVEKNQNLFKDSAALLNPITDSVKLMDSCHSSRRTSSPVSVAAALNMSKGPTNKEFDIASFITDKKSTAPKFDFIGNKSDNDSFGTKSVSNAKNGFENVTDLVDKKSRGSKRRLSNGVDEEVASFMDTGSCLTAVKSETGHVMETDKMDTIISDNMTACNAAIKTDSNTNNSEVTANVETNLETLKSTGELSSRSEKPSVNGDKETGVYDVGLKNMTVKETGSLQAENLQNLVSVSDKTVMPPYVKELSDFHMKEPLKQTQSETGLKFPVTIPAFSSSETMISTTSVSKYTDLSSSGTLSSVISPSSLEESVLSSSSLPSTTVLTSSVALPAGNVKSIAAPTTVPVMSTPLPVIMPGPLPAYGPRLACPMPPTAHVLAKQMPVGGVITPGQVVVRNASLPPPPQVFTPVIPAQFPVPGISMQGQVPPNIQMMPGSQSNIPIIPTQPPYSVSVTVGHPAVTTVTSVTSQLPGACNNLSQIPGQNVNNLSKSEVTENVDPNLFEAVVIQLKQAYPEMAKNPAMLKAVAMQQTAVLQYYVSQGNNPLENKLEGNVDCVKIDNTLCASSSGITTKTVPVCTAAKKPKSPVNISSTVTDMHSETPDLGLNEDKLVKAPPGFTERPDSLPNLDAKPKKEPVKPRNFLDDFTPSKTTSVNKTVNTLSTSTKPQCDERAQPVTSTNPVSCSANFPQKSKSWQDVGYESAKRERTISGNSSSSSRSNTPPPNVLSNFKKLPQRLPKKSYTDHLTYIQSSLSDEKISKQSDENWENEVDPYAKTFILDSRPKKEMENPAAQSVKKPLLPTPVQPPGIDGKIPLLPLPPGMPKLQRSTQTNGKNPSLGKSSKHDLYDNDKFNKSCELVTSWLNKEHQEEHEELQDSPRIESSNSSKKVSYAELAASGIPHITDTGLDAFKSPTPPVEEIVGSITDIPMPKRKTVSKEDEKSQDGSDGESWQQVTKKKKKQDSTGHQHDQGKQVLPVVRKKHQSGDTSQKSTDFGQKSSNFERLVAKLSEVFAGLNRSGIIQIITDVRNARGGLSGLTLKQIVDVAQTVVKNRSKASVRKAVKTPSPPVSGPSPISPPTSSGFTPPFLRKTYDSKINNLGKTPSPPVSGPSPISPPTSSGFTPPFLRKTYVSKINNLGNSDDDEEICVICHDGLSVYETKTLECKHVFHTRCIKEWVLGRERTCPTCRRHALFPEEFPKLGK